MDFLAGLTVKTYVPGTLCKVWGEANIWHGGNWPAVFCPGHQAGPVWWAQWDGDPLDFVPGFHQ